MRSLQDASTSWQELKQYKTLAHLREAVRLDGGHTSPIASSGLRSASWKAFLLFDSLDTAEWPKSLAASRSAYNSLRMHFFRNLDDQDELADPFDEEDGDSPSQSALRQDQDLRAEIEQDVDRCMPENTYFRQPSTQLTLTTILFVCSRLNPDISYRQGMHELLAPILWVVERDAITLGSSSKALGEDATVRAVFDAESIEADAFALFSQVMRSAKAFYEPSTEKGGENPIVLRSRRIFEEMLPQVDPELAAHLQDADVVPQIFLMRWIRLLFGREFAFDDVLTIWDVIFAEDPTLEIVDYICLAMILRIRWELLDSDYNSALTLLLRYPEPSKEHPPQSLTLDALYLRDHLDTDGSGYLVLKYTGRPVIPPHRPATPPALQRNITAFSGVPTLPASGLLPTRPGSGRRQPTNLEAVLQSTARTLYARGGQAVRGAVEEVHKRAQEIQKTQTPALPPRRGGPAALERRLGALERRNAQLGKLLEGAVGQLWEYQRVVAEQADADDGAGGGGKRAEDVEKLSVAIAKVQFVQVYLEDASLPLSSDDSQEHAGSGAGEKEEGWTRVERSEGVPNSALEEKPTLPPRGDAAPSPEALADPATFDFDSEQATPNNEAAGGPTITVEGPKSEDDAKSSVDVLAATQTAHAESPPPPPPRPAAQTPPPKPHYRPALAESPYSFMLGEQPTSGDSAARKPATASNTASPFASLDIDRRRGKGGLFGDGEGDDGVVDDGTGDGATVVHAAPRRDKRGTGGRERIRRKVVAVGEKMDGAGDGAFVGRRGSGGT